VDITAILGDEVSRLITDCFVYVAVFKQFHRQLKNI